jgi:ABC-2 type transport system ATP-binding protein
MMSQDWVIETQAVTRRFRSITAVSNLSLRIQRGEIFGLVGPDGAGKTTTIRLLAAILDPDEGRANVVGFDTVQAPESIKRHIGYMAQRFNLYGDLTVSENLNFFADLFEMSGSARTAQTERLLAFARLTEFRDRRAAHLSGGMQKKLALACTLIHTPDIIFLDEPTTGVDPIARRELWDILTGLHLQGITMVVSTPYMDEAERCSRIGLMHQGELIVCDTPAHLKSLTEGELIALWPSDLRRAHEILRGVDGILEVQVFGDQLRIFAADGEAMMNRLHTIMTAANVRILDVRRTSPRMEEAFISLIRRRISKQKQEDTL